MADTDVPKKSSETQAIYHEVSKRQILGCKVYGAITIVMVCIAVIFCIAKGTSNHHLYLLLVNLIISTLVGAAVVWWYRRGDLAADKLWFIFLVATVIIFQCITADIYVWNHHAPTSNHPASTVGPFTYASPVTVIGEKVV